ncbi:hypothetical protein [Streptomyces avidinii]
MGEVTRLTHPATTNTTPRRCCATPTCSNRSPALHRAPLLDLLANENAALGEQNVGVTGRPGGYVARTAPRWRSSPSAADRR